MKKLKLTKKLKQKWVDALESGRYNQGYLSLYNKNTDSFCALGLLGLVSGVRRSRLIGKSDLHDIKRHDLLSTKLENRIISLNDRTQKSFQDIARYVRLHVRT